MLHRGVFVEIGCLGWQPRLASQFICYVDLIVNGRIVQVLVDSDPPQLLEEGDGRLTWTWGSIVRSFN